MSGISEDSPLADQLKTAVQEKVVEAGWTQDEDDTSLAEYIVLMVANGKDQEQIAAELSGELLQDAQGAPEFAKWLMDYVAHITGGGPADEPAPMGQAQEDASIPAAYENDLGDGAPDNAPRGPKGLHGGPRGGRGGLRGAAQGRGGFDSALHRTRGNDRINSHNVRGAPKGPKNIQNKEVRPGMQKAFNNMQAPQMPFMQAGPNGAGQIAQLSPQQQMEMMAVMEQQARLWAQFMPNMADANMNGGGMQSGRNGRSMFDRVERGRGGGRGRGRGGLAQNGAKKGSEVEGEGQNGEAEVGAEADGGAAKQQNDPTNTECYFKSRCLNKGCVYAHPSPAAPPNVEIDMSNTCSFGPACKNSKCTGKHPSPALVAAHKAEQECKFWPNCSNANCPFKHPSMPLCSFGASCTNKECKFTHLQTKCKFNPCTNARCPYQHDPGQNRSMSQYTWSKDQAMTDAQQQPSQEEAQHVSDRKFVVEGEEELIKPDEQQMQEAGTEAVQQQAAEVTT